MSISSPCIKDIALGRYQHEEWDATFPVMGKHTDIMICALYGISYQKAVISLGKANKYLQKALIMRGKETKWNREKRLTL